MSQPFVIIAEDDRELGELMVHIVEMCKLRVEWIANGRDVLKRLDEIQPDLLILDMHLPLVSGLEILQSIRANPNLVTTKVALVTADIIRVEQAKGMADYVLMKPMSLDQIQALLATIQT